MRKMIKNSYSEQVEALTSKTLKVLKSYDKRKGDSSVDLQIGDMGKSDKDVKEKRRCKIHTEGKSTGASCSALFSRGILSVRKTLFIFSAAFCVACLDLFCKRAQALRNSRSSSAGSTR